MILHRRRGITLIELLIVIFIILLITSATIPAIQPAIENRRTREGARLLNVFLSAARNRAMEQARPVGVWIERMPGLSEAAVSLHFCETPRPYSGDFLDSSLTLYLEPFGAPYPSPTINEYWWIVTPRTTTAAIPDRWWNAEPNAQQLVRPGDYIKFSGMDRPLKLNVGKRSEMRLAGADGWVWYVAYGANRHRWDQGFHGLRYPSGELIISWWDNDYRGLGDWPFRTQFGPGDVRSPGVSYQVLRQPQKMLAGAIQLPEGVVIDLNYSGTASWCFHPRDNFRLDNSTGAGGTGSPFRGVPIFPNDETPVIVMFSADGVVDKVYSRCVDRVNGEIRVVNWTSWRPTEMLYFLVGDAEKVPAKSGWGTGAGGLDQYDNNWLDLTNYWVTVNPLLGLINTAEVSDFEDPNDTIAHDPNNILVSRRFANQPQSIGGR